MVTRKSKFTVPGADTKSPRRRPARVADQIRKEVAMLLLDKIKDPRLLNVVITEVSVTNDLRSARVFYNVPGDHDPADIAKGLASAKGFIRSHLARELQLRYVPDLEFREDLTFQKMDAMERLLREIKNGHDQSS